MTLHTSAVLLEGEKSKPFNTGQGVTQGCSVSPIIFQLNQSSDEVEKAGIGIAIEKGVQVGGLMLADEFVEDLQTLVQDFCNKWRLKSNIKKSVVMIFSKKVDTSKDIPLYQF